MNMVKVVDAKTLCISPSKNNRLPDGNEYHVGQTQRQLEWCVYIYIHICVCVEPMTLHDIVPHLPGEGP